MSDYLPNSNKYKKEKAEIEKKKVEKVVKGRVRTKKKSELGKLADVFISEDARNVKSYVLMDVLVPAIKKAVYDIVTDGVDMVLFGGKGTHKKRSSADRVSYNRYYNDRDSRRDDHAAVRTRYSFDDIILDSRGEAEDVLDRMFEMLDMYGVVSVADLNDLVGITGQYTDNKYGWTSLRNADVVHGRDGYMLKLPRVMPID